MAEKVQYQLNARISEETRMQLDLIVEAYRQQLPIGKVSKADVLSDIIKKSYKQLEQKGQIKAN